MHPRPVLLLILTLAAGSALAAPDDDETPAKGSHPRRRSPEALHLDPAKASPTPGKKRAAAEDEDAATPKRTSGGKASPTPRAAEDSGTTGHKPGPTPRGTPKTAVHDPEAQPPGAEGKYAPPATIATSELSGFSDQPPRVKQLLEAALELTKQNLTYKYGSADPASGGMDCSGSIYYLLRQQGFTDVPRDASGQYSWVRRHHLFYAVVSKKAGGFEFEDLRPGDLMFWSGTYSVDRDPPVTHTMIYLGLRQKKPVMWGSSDGRSFEGKARYGVSVFDFHMPRADAPPTASGQQPDFLGYARIPGLREEKEAADKAERTREAATEKTETAEKEETAETKKPATTPRPKRRGK